MSQPTKYQFMSHRSEGVRLKDDRELGSYSDIDGLPGDTAETDVTKSATRMAWLKGLVSLIKGVLGVGGDSLNVTLKGSNVTELKLQDAAAAPGNGQELNVAGMATCSFEVTGPFVGTVICEGKTSTGGWYPLNITQVGAGVVSDTGTITAVGLYVASCATFTAVRARISAYTSGAITVTGRAIPVDRANKSVALTNVEGTPGQAAPAKGILLGGKYYASGNMEALAVDLQKNLLVGLRSSAGGEPGIVVASDGQASGNARLAVLATMAGYNGATVDLRRVANVFKYASGTIASGATLTVWTPTNGKKFRAMGMAISMSVASQAFLRDGAGGGTFYATTLGTGGTDHADLGQGKLSAATNNIVELYNNGAQAYFTVAIWGTEE